MAKVPTERVTVRLNKAHLNTIDALIQIGELRNRTQAISEAVRDWVRGKAGMAKAVEQVAKGEFELQTMAAKIAQMQTQLERLQKK